MNEKDKTDLRAGRQRVLNLMLDGRWHTAAEIRMAAGEGGVPASEGLRRLRELKKGGYQYVKRRLAEDSRHYEYRISDDRNRMGRDRGVGPTGLAPKQDEPNNLANSQGDEFLFRIPPGSGSY